jgi:hypothetical protein
MRIHQADRGDAQLNFAQAAIVLPAGASTLFASRFVRAFIQDQQAPVLQRRMPSNLILDLVADGLLAPGRVAHKLLQVLAVAQSQTPLDVRVVASIFHGQLTAPIPIGLLTRIARPRPKAPPKAFPKGAQVIAQALNRLRGQSPLVGVEQIANVSGQRVIRLCVQQPADSGD